MRRLIAFAVIIAFWNFMALLFSGIDIPIPSSYISVVIMFNTIFALISVIIQRFVIVLYEANVYEKPKSTMDYIFKYFAIASSGLNYHIQVVFNRLPFILNKLASLLFFLFLIFIWFTINLIYSNT